MSNSEKTSRNSPCPCGSGKKYKRCCGFGTQSRAQQSADELIERLTNDIKTNQVTSLEEANKLAAIAQAQHNEKPINDFLGLSPTQMSMMLHEPWDSPELCTINANWYPKKSYALELFNALIEGVGEEGIKATAKGNLPIKLCREIYTNISPAIAKYKSNILSEVEFDELHTMRITAEMAGIIKLRKNYFSLTVKGKKLVGEQSRAKLFNELIKAYTTKFNWGYRDGFPEANIFQESWLYTLYCISVFGNKNRSSKFYAEYIAKAFPAVLDEFDTPYDSSEDYCSRSYKVRVLERFADFWGLIEIDKSNDPILTLGDLKVTSSNISEWIQFHA